ncbi:MAG: hypothetical protein ACFCUG_05355 [Thiotrichales bacterium]
MNAPAVLALGGVSLTVAALMLLASVFALTILRHWDVRSGSERQLRLERLTYLIATLVTSCFIAEIIAVLLFVYTAESMSSQFVGAMCATGVLNVNPWGWPTLLLKLVVALAGFVWLALNSLDQHAPDYPLVRIKYALLLAITPLVIAEAGAQTLFFGGLDPDVITSCCGALFTPDGGGVAAEVAALSPRHTAWAMMLSAIALVLGGVWFLTHGRPAGLIPVLGIAAGLIALAAIVTFIAPYIYEHPEHRCPFCILKQGHDHIGYLLYLPLFGGIALTLAVGAIAPWRRIPSLAVLAADRGRRYMIAALAAFALFYTLAALTLWRSNLSMRGVWW